MDASSGAGMRASDWYRRCRTVRHPFSEAAETSGSRIGTIGQIRARLLARRAGRSTSATATAAARRIGRARPAHRRHDSLSLRGPYRVGIVPTRRPGSGCLFDRGPHGVTRKSGSEEQGRGRRRLRGDRPPILAGARSPPPMSSAATSTPARRRRRMRSSPPGASSMQSSGAGRLPRLVRGDPLPDGQPEAASAESDSSPRRRGSGEVLAPGDSRTRIRFPREVKGLKPMYREVLALRYVDGLSLPGDRVPRSASRRPG